MLAPPTCDHLAGLTAADFPPVPTPLVCQDCVVEGTTWVHLRECRECGHVGCCDSSPRTHAARHFRSTRHPVVRSLEPDETWDWCYEDHALGDLGV